VRKFAHRPLLTFVTALCFSSSLHLTPKWQWRCGFYPGAKSGQCTNGTAATFQAAREAFEVTWRAFLANRTEADFKTWREQQAWTAEKYRRFDQGERMPADWQSAQQTNLIR
jgi:hypothetical protein